MFTFDVGFYHFMFALGGASVLAWALGVRNARKVNTRSSTPPYAQGDAYWVALLLVNLLASLVIQPAGIHHRRPGGVLLAFGSWLPPEPPFLRVHAF